MWTLPEFLPINCIIMHKSHRLCEPDINKFSKEEVIISNSTIHIMKAISYGSHNCGNDNITLVTKDVITTGFFSKND